MRFRLGLAYVGTAYAGWQLQRGPLALKTVQGQLERALASLAGEKVRVHGAGRTDSGVHAEGQCAHFDFPDARLAHVKDMRHALNALLPEDIRVFLAEPCDDAFHARFCAVGKTYRYWFWTENAFVPPRLVPYVWRCGPLDKKAMDAALAFLVGEHDFATLANAGSVSPGSTVRNLFFVSLDERAVWPGCRPMLELHVQGSGFLKQMVRNMAGLLAAVGRGALDPGRIPDLLAARSRKALPTATAPGCGLTMVRVHYDAEDCLALRTALAGSTSSAFPG